MNTMTNDRVMSTYADDDAVLENGLKEETQLRSDIEAMLEERGYDMYAVIRGDGSPDIELKKAL